MARWRCPRCDREFGSARQAHVCVPGITVATLLSRHPAWVGQIFAAVAAELAEAGPVHEDAVEVGVFFKAGRTVAQFRPKVRAVELWLFLPERVEDPRIARSVDASASRVAHLIKLTKPAQIDQTVRGWIQQAYDYNSG